MTLYLCLLTGYSSFMNYYVGTSGWLYPHWRDVFYPRGLPSSRWLGFYSQHFRTLEVNASFYRQIRPSTFEKWYNMVPEDFSFSIKMSRFITHIKRLRVDRSSLDLFLENSSILKEKLAVILIQLPPGLKFDALLVRDFLDMLDTRFRYTMEVRNTTFLDDAFFSLLTERRIAWCVADTAGRYPYGETITAPFVYVRLHGSESLYGSDYTEEELRTWASKIRDWNRDTFVYFDNDFNGYAAKNAASLARLLESLSH